MKGFVVKRSMKTTLTGLSAVLTAGGAIMTGIANGDSELIMSALPGLLAGLGLVFARDNNVSSQDAGIR